MVMMRIAMLVKPTIVPLWGALLWVSSLSCRISHFISILTHQHPRHTQYHHYHHYTIHNPSRPPPLSHQHHPHIVINHTTNHTKPVNRGPLIPLPLPLSPHLVNNTYFHHAAHHSPNATSLHTSFPLHDTPHPSWNPHLSAWYQADPW